LPEDTPNIFSSRAALSGYLQIVEKLYMDDQLDVAVRAAQDAFETTGWPAGGWTEFYNRLVCEKEARDFSAVYKLDPTLTIEISRDAPSDMREGLESAALDARQKVTSLLEMELKIPCIVSVFLPDAPLEFISGSYGYAMRKNSLSKICLPWECAQSHERALRTLTHEFAHVACYELLEGKDEPSWLAEGLALYLCGDVSDEKCRQLVQSDPKFARLLSMSHLQTALSSSDLRKDDPELVSAAYKLAGSLVAWWVGKKGLHSLRDAMVMLARGWNTTLATYVAAEMSPHAIERGWRDYILGPNPHQPLA
jgi:hypothetical protein